MPTQERLRELFHYDLKTGDLFNKVTRSSTARAGALSTHVRYGYKHVRVDRGLWSAHRLIWVLHNGPISSRDYVDHQDHDSLNNRIENLRLTNSAGNNRNRSLPRNNTSGCMGVYYARHIDKWASTITVDGDVKTLGYFADKAEAIQVRKAAELRYGFHKNHGSVRHAAAA